jgi:hypothetical protein
MLCPALCRAFSFWRRAKRGQQWLLRSDSSPSFNIGGPSCVDGEPGEGEPVGDLRVVTARRLP